MKESRNIRSNLKQTKGRIGLPIVVLASFAMGNLIDLARADQASAIRDITDGRPWKMTMEDGRVTVLVLFENGTGKMTGGPVELSPKWRPTPDGLCLKPAALLPERCMQLIRSSNGYLGLNAGKQIFRLQR